MKKLCKTCFYWHQLESDYYLSGGVGYGDCVCGKLIYKDGSCPLYATDQLIYWDYEGYDASIATGPEYGCVHWRKKDKEAKK